MANVRDSDTSLWLHNKLGTSNDSWISGSICSQLNKEVLRNIKECFSDLQTQVKLKLLLSFFHIPRRLVEEWKTELEEVIEVAGGDSELWVSMLAESMKTFPANSSLNTEISDYEDTRPIFTEMVNDLRKLVAKHSDLGMLPLECQYLNKNALVSVVGQQANPIKHFTIKRKPKSATLRTELLHKSADAQSSLKKSSAPTIPLRSRGMPRKMTDTTPLKGIPSRMPTSGFRSTNINVNNQQRPNLSRTQAGRKDGGIKLIEFTEQPLGYVAAKKRKREQQLEEQAKKQEQKAAAAAAAAAAVDNESPPLPSLQNVISTGSGDGSTAGNNNSNTIDALSNNFEIKTEPLIQTDANNCLDERFTVNIDSKEDIQQEIISTNRVQNNMADMGSGVITTLPTEVADTTTATTTPVVKMQTPEYAPPSLSYTTQTSGVSLIDSINQCDATIIEDSKSNTQKFIGRLRNNEKINSNNNNTTQNQNQKNSNIITSNNNSNNNNDKNNTNGNSPNVNLNLNSHKRIKQEIEIKSEEILVPDNIKVEKLEMSTVDNQVQTTQTLLQKITQQQQKQQQQQIQLQTQMPQRIIIQQQQHQPQSLPILQHIQAQTNQQQQQQHQHQLQPTTQHVIIRTSPQTPKQTVTLRQPQQNAVNTSPIKMEKLEIKPLLRSSIGQISQGTTILRSNAATSTTATPSTVTNSNNPLANLPNNISVKITSTKSNKVNQGQQTVNLQQQSSQYQQQQQQPILINSSTPVILASTPAQVAALRQKQLNSNAITVQNATPQTAQAIKSMPLSQLKNATNSGPVIISQTIIQPAKRSANNNQHQQQQQQQQKTSIIQPQKQSQQNQPTTTQYILSQSPTIGQQQQQQHTNLSTLTTYTPSRLHSQQQQQVTFQQASPQTSTPTKILLKTVNPSSGVVIRQQQTQQTQSGPPPLIASAITNVSAAPTLLSIQNVQLPNRPVTIQPASQAAQQQHLQAQLQQQQQQQQHTLVSNNTATQQPKLTQVLMQTAAGNSGGGTISTQGAHVTNATIGTPPSLKNKTIIVTQKGLILRNIAGDMYEQIPISSVSGLQTLGGGGAVNTGTLLTTTSNPSNLVKTTTVSTLPQTQMITLQPQQQQSSTAQVTKTHLPTLMPTQSHMIVQQQPQVTTTLLTNQPTQQAIIRPVVANVSSGLTNLPSGLTLIQRPGQQPQLIQVQQAPTQQAQIQRTIIAQPALQQKSQQQQQQLRPQQIVLQQKPGTTATQRIITTAAAAPLGGQHIQLQQTGAGNIQRVIQIPQQQPQIHAAPQRKGITLSNEHVHKAHEMFRKANRVSRPEKALILAFMAGVRENPRPNSENVLVIKLGETEEKMQQEDGSTALCLVESHIRLDYNTGEWKTFQNYRRLDQGCTQSNVTGDTTNPNTVVI